MTDTARGPGVGAQFDYYRLGILVSRDPDTQTLRTKKLQLRGIHFQEHVTTSWWHIEGFQRASGLVGVRQDYAEEQAEWLADRNALWALACQVTPPGLGINAGVRVGAPGMRKDRTSLAGPTAPSPAACPPVIVGFFGGLTAPWSLKGQHGDRQHPQRHREAQRQGRADKHRCHAASN